MFDTLIIGAGPAGMAAAIYAARRQMKTLVIAKEIGGQMALAGEIENYPGFKTIPAYELIAKMQEQVADNGVEIKNDEVQRVERHAGGNYLVFTNREQFETKTLIIAMGLSARRLAIPGETELSGKGVSYCANCDGPLFKNKIVGVIGGGNAALDAADVLSKIAKQVFLINRTDQLTGFEALIAEIEKRSNIEVIMRARTEKLIGADKLERVLIKLDDGTEREIGLDGLFIEIGRIAHTDLVAHLVERNDKHQIKVNDKGETSAPGIFAAGDTTNREFKQISVAVGEGTAASLAASQYLQLKNGRGGGTVLDRSIKKNK